MMKPLSEIELQRRARKLVSQLKQVNPYEAAQILNKALTVVLQENNRVFKSLQKQPVMPINPDFFMNDRHPSIIDSDPEIKAFLLSLDTKSTIDQRTQACIDKFGKKRHPAGLR